jgi:hypothetical protein
MDSDKPSVLSLVEEDLEVELVDRHPLDFHPLAPQLLSDELFGRVGDGTDPHAACHHFALDEAAAACAWAATRKDTRGLRTPCRTAGRVG